MSNTYHHNSPTRARLMRIPNRYTGWVGEGCWSQNGKQFIKRIERRANRRWGKSVITNILKEY